MIYKRYFKKSETPDDDEAVSDEEAEDQDPESKHFTHTKPTSSQGILAQKLHDYIGKKLGEGISPQEHAAAIRTILTQVKDPVSGEMKFKYFHKDMTKLFEEHPREPTRGVPQKRTESLSDKPLTYTPTEMIGPTASIARMRIPNDEYASVRAPEFEEVQPTDPDEAEEVQPTDPDEAEDVWLSLGKNTQNLDIMVKSLLRKIANGEI